MAYDNKVCNRGVYVVRDENNNVKYIGSSKLTLRSLEYNHRNWFRIPGYSGTLFRECLVDSGKKWTFNWLVERFKCDAKTIEHIEGCLIRQLTPELNRDMDPVASSMKYGRY